jgi:hypothetical protein
VLGFGLSSLASIFLARPRWRGIAVFLGLFAAVLVWWLLLPPSNERDWQPDVAKLAWADIRGDAVTVHNVRNNTYRSEADYTVHYEDQQYDLAALRALDLFVSYWGSPVIAHTIVSFGFADGRHLAFSIETRKEKGEDYSAVKGFFKQYELIVIAADERDVVGLRTNYRGEDVYLYRIQASPAGIRSVFLNYLALANRLHAGPEWYNALTHNCTTTIRGLAPSGAVGRWPSWQLFLNGYLDQLLYARGVVTRSLPFADLRSQSHINERARRADDAPDFSRRIREGLPGMNEASGTRP